MVQLRSRKETLNLLHHGLKTVNKRIVKGGHYLVEIHEDFSIQVDDIRNRAKRISQLPLPEHIVVLLPSRAKTREIRENRIGLIRMRIED
jgi:hypothetical protein